MTQEIQALQGRKQQLISKRDKLKDAIQQDKSAHLAQKNWDREGEVMNSFFLCVWDSINCQTCSILWKIFNNWFHLYQQWASGDYSLTNTWSMNFIDRNKILYSISQSFNISDFFTFLETLPSSMDINFLHQCQHLLFSRCIIYLCHNFASNSSPSNVGCSVNAV